MSDFKIVQLLNPIQINTNINPTGAYNAGTTYAIGDSVSYNNSSYIAIQATTGNVPTNTTYWQLLASSSTLKLSTTAGNVTGTTIPKGAVIYFNGASGNLPTITLAQANSEANSSKTAGITAVAIPNNSNGEVVVSGLIDSLDTSSLTVGLAVWLSPTIAGGMTNTKPSAPNNTVFIGVVTRSHPTQGTIEINIQNGFELEDLHNVSITSLVDNQVLKYDAPNLLWKNETLVKGDVGLGDVPNKDATNPANIGQTSSYRFVTDTEKATFNNKVDRIGDNLTGTLYSDGPAGSGYYNSLITTCADTDGLAQISFDSDTFKRLSVGIANSLLSPVLGIFPDYAFQHSNVGYISIVDSLAGFKWVQNGSEGASLASGAFFSNASLSSPVVRVTSATASRVAVFDASKNVVSSSVSTTTLGYLDATSSVQTQIDSKIDNTQSIINALIFG